MCAAVDHDHHWHGKYAGIVAANRTIEGHLALGSGGVGEKCESPFSVMEIGLRADAGGLLPVKTLIDAPAGVINGATIAVELGRTLYVGAFTGERVAKYAR
jgi:hypothetical protein